MQTSLPMKLIKNILSTVSKMIAIAIGDRKATIEIGDLFLNGDRDLKFDQDLDRDRDRNFRDRGHALITVNSIEYTYFDISNKCYAFFRR